MKTILSRCGRDAWRPSHSQSRGAMHGQAPIAPAAARATAMARPATRTAGAAARSTRPARAPSTATCTAAALRMRTAAAPSTPTCTAAARTARHGSGAYHTYPSGATAYHPPGYPAYPTYPVYHPPVAVPYYSSGCYGCAAAAGAVVGVAVGAAAASANTAAATSTAYARVWPPAARNSRGDHDGVCSRRCRRRNGSGGCPHPVYWVMGMNYATIAPARCAMPHVGSARTT